MCPSHKGNCVGPGGFAGLGRKLQENVTGPIENSMPEREKKQKRKKRGLEATAGSPEPLGRETGKGSAIPNQTDLNGRTH